MAWQIYKDDGTGIKLIGEINPSDVQHSAKEEEVDSQEVFVKNNKYRSIDEPWEQQ